MYDIYSCFSIFGTKLIVFYVVCNSAPNITYSVSDAVRQKVKFNKKKAESHALSAFFKYK